MKRILAPVAVLLLVSLALAVGGESEPASKPAGPPPLQLTTPVQRLSYALGMEIAGSLKKLDADVDLAVLIRGLEDAATQKETLLSTDEAANVRYGFGRQRQEERARRAQDLPSRNREEGKEFLLKNGEKEGVVTTESGLQYEVLKEGDGPTPGARDKVTVHYRGTLLDGTEFDSSYRGGEPSTFSVGGVIRGWTEALRLMKVGAGLPRPKGAS